MSISHNIQLVCIENAEDRGGDLNAQVHYLIFHCVGSLPIQVFLY